MNEYVQRYYVRRNEGFDPLNSFGIVASSISISGTIEDLRMLDREFQADSLKYMEGLTNERTTSTISITE